jgi:5-methylcytosine-specific restriction endonuclease McrA
LSATPIADLPFTSWRKVRAFVLQRDRFICGYCLDEANSVDHIVPVVRQGAFFDPQNLTAACMPCNRSKGTLTAYEWFDREWGGRIPPWFTERGTT